MERLREFSSFDSLEQMNETIREALEKYVLTETERSVLWKLSQYSCKVIGVSYLKVDSLAQIVKVSKRTIQRSLKRLGELGIIKRIKQLRKVSGGYGSSLTVILDSSCHIVTSPRQENTKADTSKDDYNLEPTETIISKAKSSLNNKERKESKVDTYELDSSYLANGIVPEKFINEVKPFFSSAKEVYNLWKKTVHVGSKYAPSLVDYTEVAIQGFKQSVFARKLNKIKGSFQGYYWGTLRNMLTVEQRRASFDNSSIYYDWLN